MNAARTLAKKRWTGVSAAERSRIMTELRAKGGGRPRSTAPRCPCGKFTQVRADKRGHQCEAKPARAADASPCAECGRLPELHQNHGGPLSHDHQPRAIARAPIP